MPVDILDLRDRRSLKKIRKMALWQCGGTVKSIKKSEDKFSRQKKTGSYSQTDVKKLIQESEQAAFNTLKSLTQQQQTTTTLLENTMDKLTTDEKAIHKR